MAELHLLSLDSSLHLPILRTSQTHLLFLCVPVGCGTVLHEARAVYGSIVEVFIVQLWSHIFVSWSSLYDLLHILLSGLWGEAGSGAISS